jgi:hypothetical protein
MRNIPEIHIKKKNANAQREFSGLNNTKRIQENQFAKLVNMSADIYPILTTRGKRYKVHESSHSIDAIRSHGNYFFQISNLRLKRYKNGIETEYNKWLTETGKKEMIKMGGNIVILPDKKMYVFSDDDIKNMTFSLTRNNNTDPNESDDLSIHLQPVTLEKDNNGNNIIYKPPVSSQHSPFIRPDNPVDGDIYFDTKIPWNIEKYNGNSETWDKLDLKTDIVIGFRNTEELDVYNIVNAIEIDSSYMINGTGKISSSEGKELIDDISKKELKILHAEKQTVIDTTTTPSTTRIYLHIVVDYLSTKYTQKNNPWFKLEKIWPAETLSIKMECKSGDFRCVSQNRMWSCSSDKHEIYASKLGDPTSWNSYDGIASDSYTVTVGSTEDFTGAYTYNDYPIFFKENRIITIRGTRPSNYQLTDVECDGVADGSDKSLTVVNGYLYYLSRKGIMRYGGDYPTKISSDIDGEKYHDGIGGSYGDKYYLKCKDRKNKSHLFVYDTISRIWTEESAMNFSQFEIINGNLYGVVGDGIYYIAGTGENIEITSESAVEEADITFEFETGDLLQHTEERTVINRINMEFELKGNVEVFIKYDNDTVWNSVYRKSAQEKEMQSFRVKPKRNKKIQLRVKGKGEFTLYELTKIVQSGGKI